MIGDFRRQCSGQALRRRPPPAATATVRPPGSAHYHRDRRGPVRPAHTFCPALPPRSRSSCAQLGPCARRGEQRVGWWHPRPAPLLRCYVITTSLLYHYFILNTLNLSLLHHYCIPIIFCYSCITDLLLHHYYISISITTSLLHHYY
jgi:hypothetical protein